MRIFYRESSSNIDEKTAEIAYNAFSIISYIFSLKAKETRLKIDSTAFLSFGTKKFRKQDIGDRRKAFTP